jgi:hypothetical protein
MDGAEMSDGGKGDKRRPLVIPEEQFNAQWDSIFNSKKLVEEAPWQPGYEDAAMTTFTTQDRLDAQRTPLTEEQIDNILESIEVYIGTHAGVLQFARAIERAHGIGE